MACELEEVELTVDELDPALEDNDVVDEATGELKDEEDGDGLADEVEDPVSLVDDERLVDCPEVELELTMYTVVVSVFDGSV